MEIDVLVSGDEEAAALVDRLSQRLKDGRPQFLKLVDTLRHTQQSRFAGFGQRWRRLSRHTIREHAKHGRGPQPLLLTGELAKSLTVAGHKNQIVRVSPTTLTFGTSVWYAHFHQRGQGVPRRTVVGLTRVQRKNVVGQLRDLLLEDL